MKLTFIDLGEPQNKPIVILQTIQPNVLGLFRVGLSGLVTCRKSKVHYLLKLMFGK